MWLRDGGSSPKNSPRAVFKTNEDALTMNTTVAFFAVVLLFGFDCGMSTEPTQPRYIERMPVESVTMPDTIRLGETIDFKAVVGVPFPCWTFRSITSTEGEMSFSIEVYAQYNGEPCIQVVSSFEAEGSLKPSKRGTYSIAFWQRDGQVLSKTCVVE
jgi:hypothetical protein